MDYMTLKEASENGVLPPDKSIICVLAGVSLVL